MHTLRIHQNGALTVASFEGPKKLQEILIENGILPDHPCGGRGTCGKCKVVLEGSVSAPNEAEKKAGHRLSCQTMILADAQVWLADTQENRIELSGGEIAAEHICAASGIGAAVDIGTTTLALKLYNLQNGCILGESAAMNPQRSISADVMGRIGAALEGQAQQLQQQIQQAIESLLQQACAQAGICRDAVTFMVVTGNTTMLYLLTGRNPEPLSHAPFEADWLFGEQTQLLGIPVYYPPCMNAFVGADITCAVAAAGMHQCQQTSLLCDIGTNGEIALWKEGKLYVTSTAAGPAFEGAGISCGCGSIDGAVDKVWVEDGQVKIHTIGEKLAVGVCGSGLIDAIAAFLEIEEIDETGAMEEDELILAEKVALQPQDVRAVQLAKAAIAAGIQTLLAVSGTAEEEITTLYIAGGFGSHLNVASAAAIGLIPESLVSHVKILGNAALTGATAVLLNPGRREELALLAQNTTHVNLGGNPQFNQLYMENMLFGLDDFM